MKFKLHIALGILLLGVSATSHAVPIEVNFADYTPCDGVGQCDLDNAAANTFFNDNYGITFQDVYLYIDARDTFDGRGIANDITGAGSTGSIFFSDTTDFVTVDWVTISSNDIFIDVYDALNNVVDSFFFAGSGTSEGTVTLTGTNIAKMTFNDNGGTVGISSLKYDYDGTTDGTNNDIPEPSSLLLFGLGLLGFRFLRKKNI